MRQNYNDEETKGNHLGTNESTESNQSHHSSPNEPNHQHNAASKGRKGKGSMVLSGIVGGLIVAIIGVLLLSSNVIPTNGQDTTASTSGDANNEETDNEANGIQSANTGDGEPLTEAINKVSKAVVGVTNIQQKSLFGESSQAGTGSGVIYKKENGQAYVVTNNHVVEGSNRVEVILNGGKHIEAKILGTDPLSDLAVLQIDGKNVEQVATLGSSGDLTVGQTALAIGNPLGMEFANTVTKGIVSGLNRSVPVDINGDRQQDWVTQVIQTDAAINPGNSGGALTNSDGVVIGINSMKIARAAVEGIGFAIPMETAKPIIKQLENNGKVTRPFIGIGAVALTQVPTAQAQQELSLPENVTEGLVIAQVEQGSPASEAGLQQYDVITQINGNKVTSLIDLRKYLYNETEVGEEVKVTFYRDGNKETTSLTLAQK